MKRLTRTENILILLTLAFLALAAFTAFSGRGAGVTVERGGAVESAPAPSPSPSPEPLGVVNINTASAEELARLPGVGETLAARIVDYRAAHGAFAAAEEIMNVSGIGQATFEGLRGDITTGGTP